jgi:hypothetical protein
MVHNMHSLLSEYFSTEILVLHAIRCRVAQAESYGLNLIVSGLNSV